MDTRKTLQGSKTAEEIYYAVGLALSWWESSEDILLGLFKYMNFDNLDRVRSYGLATRNVRSQMLDKTLRLDKRFFNADELVKLQTAISGLSQLVTRRNEISHGHCSQCNASDDNGKLMEGYFLIPAFNEIGPMERLTDMRFLLTASDIHSFTRTLRMHRSVVMSAQSAALMRAMDLRAKAECREVYYGPNTVDFWKPFYEVY